MTWRPRPRAGVDPLDLPLDSRQGYLLSRLEGIIPAIESAHAVALAMKELKGKKALSIINLSGRGDKDVEREMENE